MSELLQIADAVAREKVIPRDSVIEAMEQAIQVVARRKYGHEHMIKAEIDRKSGEIRLFRVLKVVEDDAVPVTTDGEGAEDEETFAPISLSDAHISHPEAKVGETILEQLPTIDLGRVAAQTAKQVIVQKVRDAERERQFNDFKDRVGEIVHGIVKKFESGYIVVDLGRAEAALPLGDLIGKETFKQNDRVRAYVRDVRREGRGPQIFLSRSHPQFLAKLFAQEVPEVYDNIIEIKGVAREPGSRAKMAVYTQDSSIDPVGSCVGVRGARVQAVITELQGEKIDIIPWSADPATFVVNALSPAEVSKVVIDEERRRIEVVVPDDHLSLAIGRRGQNVRLASHLTGWNIDVLTEDEESKRRMEAFNTLTQFFMEVLNVEEVMAQLLVSEGFTAIEEIAYSTLEDLASIEGFDEAIAEELRQRALHYIEQQQALIAEGVKTLGVEAAVGELPGVTAAILEKLAVHAIKTLEDVAEMTKEEFVTFAPESGLTDEKIETLILTAKERLEEDDQTTGV